MFVFFFNWSSPWREEAGWVSLMSGLSESRRNQESFGGCSEGKEINRVMVQKD